MELNKKNASLQFLPLTSLARYLRARSTHRQILSSEIKILVMFTYSLFGEVKTLLHTVAH